MECFDDKNVLITGGTGSFGHTATQELLKHNIASLTIYSRDEEKQLSMKREFADDRIGFVIGDVRDYEAILEAVRGVDIVYHAAALKIIPTCEQYPMESLKTNVVGTWNVKRAASRNGVERAVFIGTDKACLDYHTRIELADGSKRAIRLIVNNRERIKVKTITENGKIGESYIIGWYKNKLNGRKMYSLSYKNAYRHTGKHRIWVTDNHLILTPFGWKEASKLKNGNLIVTGEPSPNELQMSLLCGSLLGDSCITINSKNARGQIKFGQAKINLEWLKISYKALFGLKLSNIHLEKRDNFYNYVLGSSGYIALLKRDFYRNGKKCVPMSLIKKYFNPILLAAWFMDDGCISYNNARIATHGYSKDEVDDLVKLFEVNGFKCWLYPAKVEGKIYYELRFDVLSSKKLFDIIGKYIPKTMRRKIYKDSPQFEPNSWNFGSPNPFIDEIIIKEIKAPTRDVYCIDVENTHNFVANGIVVHNCQPVNVYGACKMFAEKLWIQSQAEGTRFSSVRYGNILGSRGSIVPYFKELVKQGKPLPITHLGMTRFTLTLKQAFALVMRATEEAKGGEIYVPKIPACKVTDLGLALYGENYLAEVVGVRQGEKIHETLINQEESRRTEDKGEHYIIHPYGKYENNEPTEYSSDKTRTLTVPELREMLKGEGWICSKKL